MEEYEKKTGRNRYGISNEIIFAKGIPEEIYGELPVGIPERTPVVIVEESLGGIAKGTMAGTLEDVPGGILKEPN